MAARAEFAAAARARGMIDACTDEEGLTALAVEGAVPAYIGFDATADSLHVGSLLQIMLLRRLQQAGHKPIVLMGGGTTKVGDPTGKDEARKLLSDADIAANIASNGAQVAHVRWSPPAGGNAQLAGLLEKLRVRS